jgi:phage terminase large subunit-like protein
MDYAQAVSAGTVSDSRLFFFHRGASDAHDLTTDEGVRAAVLEASGPVAEWSDIDSIIEQWRDPTADRAYLERVWLNRLVRSSSQAFDVEQWKRLTKTSPVNEGDLITLGFDGAMFHDSTALVATHVETGYQWVVGSWECPIGRSDWQVPTDEVDAAVRDMFERYHVWRLYADPPYWQSWVAEWAGEFGAERVHEWWTNRRRSMRAALEAFDTAIKEGGISHSGDAHLIRHLGNARKHELPQLDEHGRPLWLIRKERSDSPHKIDLAMAAVLSWAARNDAIASGEATGASVWESDEYELLTL